MFIFPRACPPASPVSAYIILRFPERAADTDKAGLRGTVPGLEFSLQVSETPELLWELIKGGIGIQPKCSSFGDFKLHLVSLFYIKLLKII